MSSSLFALHRCHVLNVVPFLSGVCFFSVERESEIEDDNTKNEYLIIDEQVKHKNTEELYLVINEQGKRSPIISKPMFAKYFSSRYIAYDSNVPFHRYIELSYLLHIPSLSPKYPDPLLLA